MKAGATATGSVLNATWKTTKDFVDLELATKLKALKIQAEHLANR